MVNQATDTAYMRLTRVRIPRSHMLCRHQQLDADGDSLVPPTVTVTATITTTAHANSVPYEA